MRYYSLVNDNELEAYFLSHNKRNVTHQIQVVNTPVLVLELGHLKHMRLSMVVVPQLGDNEELFTLHDTLLERTAHTLASLGGVLVIVCTVNVPVAELDGIVHGVGRVLCGYLPDAIAHDGHVLVKEEGELGQFF